MVSDDARPPSWAVVVLVLALAVWLTVASVLASAVTAPRAAVPRRRARYVGSHSRKRVTARG